MALESSSLGIPRVLGQGSAFGRWWWSGEERRQEATVSLMFQHLDPTLASDKREVLISLELSE